MNEAELFKLAQNLDEDVNLSDFNNLNDENAGNDEEITAKSLIDAAKTQNDENKNEKAVKNCKNKDVKRFKEQYFAYYDDVKHKSDIEW